VHVVWEDDRDGNREEYYKRSTDGGINWGADTRLTNAPGLSGAPSISVSGSIVHVVWHDERDDFNGRIYYKRSTDGGISWGADTRLTNDPAYTSSPSVSVSGSGLHIVWVDQRDGNFEIYYKRSTDGGVSWGADTRLTNNSALSLNPFVSVSGLFVHVVWRDNRDGTFEIYYKRDPTGNPDGIIIINSEIPQNYELYQNYPNPFNPSTTIKFAIPKSGNVSLKVYDITGREVRTIIDNIGLNAGTVTHKFDGTDLASGVYFYSLIVDVDKIDTKKMIIVK
jgi:hypothetical protein